MRAIEVGTEALRCGAPDRGPELDPGVPGSTCCIAEFVHGRWDEVVEQGDEPGRVGFGGFNGYVYALRAAISQARGEPIEGWSPVDAVDPSERVMGQLVTAAQAAERRDPDTGRLAVDAVGLEFGRERHLRRLLRGLAAGDRPGAGWSATGPRSTRCSPSAATIGDNRPPTGVRAVGARLRGLLAIHDGADPAVVEEHFRTAITPGRGLALTADPGPGTGRSRRLAALPGP